MTGNWVYLEIAEELKFGKCMLQQATGGSLEGLRRAYGQGVRRGGHPARVQTVSSLAWGWGGVVGRCSLARK